MATGAQVQAADTPANHDPEKPNHMILWLDKTIGNPKEYVHLKKAFGSNTDPRCEISTMLRDSDYETIIDTGEEVSVTFEGVTFLLQAFNNEDACLAAFEKNQDKHIFFITSGSMGQYAVPKIIERYRNVFTDPIIDKPYMSVYVFCHNIELHMEWAYNYADYVQIFDFDSALLERMTRDIAEYFIERGKRLRQDENLEEALKHLYWAKRLWCQYDKMQQRITIDNPREVSESEGSRKIDKLIDEFEELYKKLQDDDN